MQNEVILNTEARSHRVISPLVCGEAANSVFSPRHFSDRQLQNFVSLYLRVLI